MRKLIIYLMAVAFIFACAGPAMAADKKVSFYGEVRFNTFWLSKDKETANILKGGNVHDKTANELYDETDIFWDIDTSKSRFGAKFKEGDISARVEIRPDNGNYYRHWYAEWDFGPGKLLVGQAWTPTHQTVSCCVFGGGDDSGYGGATGSHRKPQIGLEFPFEIGNLKLAFIKPSTKENLGLGDTESMIPKIEFAWEGKAGPVQYVLFGGYNWLKARDITNDNTFDVNGYTYGVLVDVPIGPFYFKASYYTCRNPEEYEYKIDVPNHFYASLSGNNVVDTDVDGFFGEVGWVINEMFTIAAGYGYLKFEKDNAIGSKDEDPRQYYYLTLPIKVAKNVTIAPEIGVFDEKDHTIDNVSTDNGSVKYFGAYWQIDF